jgi:hypothetical protein
MKTAVLLLALFLVGCSTVPTTVVEPPAELQSDAPLSVEVASAPRLAAAPPPPSIKGGSAPKSREEPMVNSLRTRPAEESADLLERMMSVEASSAPPVLSTKTKIKTTTTTDSSGKVSTVVEKEEEIIITPVLPVEPKPETDWFEKIVSNLTKLIALLTGTLGLYVGVQKFRQPSNSNTPVAA